MTHSVMPRKRAITAQRAYPLLSPGSSTASSRQSIKRLPKNIFNRFTPVRKGLPRISASFQKTSPSCFLCRTGMGSPAHISPYLPFCAVLCLRGNFICLPLKRRSTPLPEAPAWSQNGLHLYRNNSQSPQRISHRLCLYNSDIYP